MKKELAKRTENACVVGHFFPCIPTIEILIFSYLVELSINYCGTVKILLHIKLQTNTSIKCHDNNDNNKSMYKRPVGIDFVKEKLEHRKTSL